jgi:hypothetical protein
MPEIAHSCVDPPGQIVLLPVIEQLAAGKTVTVLVALFEQEFTPFVATTE